MNSCEHGQLALLVLGLLLAARSPKRVGRLDPPLPLALEHLELLLVVQRPLQLLLRRPQRRQDQPQRVAPIGVARSIASLQLVLDPPDQAHAGSP